MDNSLEQKLFKVSLRFLIPDDISQIKELCGDWFPIDYPPFWYECITETDQYYALAALHNSTIIGLLVAQTKPLADMNPEDHQILLHADLHDGNIGYILTLGVRKPYRRLGLATLLLNQYMEHLRLDCHIKLQNFNLTEPKCLGSKTPIDFKASQFPGHVNNADLNEGGMSSFSTTAQLGAPGLLGSELHFKVKVQKLPNSESRRDVLSASKPGETLENAFDLQKSQCQELKSELGKNGEKKFNNDLNKCSSNGLFQPEINDPFHVAVSESCLALQNLPNINSLRKSSHLCTSGDNCFFRNSQISYASNSISSISNAGNCHDWMHLVDVDNRYMALIQNSPSTDPENQNYISNNNTRSETTICQTLPATLKNNNNSEVIIPMPEIEPVNNFNENGVNNSTEIDQFGGKTLTIPDINCNIGETLDDCPEKVIQNEEKPGSSKGNLGKVNQTFVPINDKNFSTKFSSKLENDSDTLPCKTGHLDTTASHPTILSSYIVESEVSHNDVLQRLRCYSAAHADAPVTAVLLHVLSTNAEAIHFYTRRNFSRLAFLPMFYLIKDSRMDGYSYVFYLNGGEPPTSFFSDPLKSLDLPPSPSLSDFSLVPLKMAGKVARWVLGPDRTRVMSFVVTSFFELMGKMVTSLVGTDNR
ncbi:uncharacterized protein LOC108682513 [Hyalella azteca]|uniref:N-alpha-acetyltransferase 60 n=1 Tax=Hyalella azteca TaxID=294128 RepID=A0A8B7PLX0_HYAAZ|nr:uncharacterized protein LOC108682513 [Hyalella azteca]